MCYFVFPDFQFWNCKREIHNTCVLYLPGFGIFIEFAGSRREFAAFRRAAGTGYLEIGSKRPAGAQNQRFGKWAADDLKTRRKTFVRLTTRNG